MDRQPVALEGWHKRGDLGVYAWDDGGQGNRQKSKGGNKNTYDLLLIFKFKNQVNQDNGPGKEDQGFVHIG
jgi:hypothetical protein